MGLNQSHILTSIVVNDFSIIVIDDEGSMAAILLVAGQMGINVLDSAMHVRQILSAENTIFARFARIVYIAESASVFATQHTIRACLRSGRLFAHKQKMHRADVTFDSEQLASAERSIR